MFENVDGKRTDGRTDDERRSHWYTGILLTHIGTFGSGELTTSRQQQNHRLRTDSSLSHRGGGGLNLRGQSNYYVFLQLYFMIVYTLYYL